MAINKNLIISSLTEKMRVRGFSLKKNDDRFIRKTAFGAQYFQLVFTWEADWLRVAPGAYVRFDSVENLFEDATVVSPNVRGSSFTLGIDFHRYYDDKSLKFAGKETSDLDHLVPSLLDTYEKYAEKFFEKYTELSDIDLVFNHNPNETCPYRPMPWLRAATGVIVASLLKRPDYTDIINLHRNNMKIFSNGFFLRDFDRLVDLLDNR